MYNKHGRHDIDAEAANNEYQFATQFSNFMRKHSDIVISQVSVPQINLNISTAPPRAVPAPFPITKSTMWMTSINTLPLLLKIHQLNKLFSIILLHISFSKVSSSHYPSSSKSTS
jgi:hypothetical protein